jgi:hypothetical protein
MDIRPYLLRENLMLFIYLFVFFLTKPSVIQNVWHMAGLREPLWARMPKFSLKFKEILWRTYGNFEEKNKVLNSSIIIINYCIIINAYYNYVV